MIYGIDEKIKEQRLKRKLTQEELGAKLGVKGSTVSGYETGKSYPSADVLCEMCSIFNVRADYLLGLDSREWMLLEGLTDAQKQVLQAMADQLRNPK